MMDIPLIRGKEDVGIEKVPNKKSEFVQNLIEISEHVNPWIRV